MIHILILYYFLCNIGLINPLEIQKCCPSNEVLYISAINSEVKCIKNFNNYTFESSGVTIVRQSLKEFSTPVCSENDQLMVTRLENNFSYLNNYKQFCLDITNLNELYGIYCKYDYKRDRGEKIFILKKCASMHTQKILTAMETYMKRHNENLNTSFIYLHGVPVCNPFNDELIIEEQFSTFIIHQNLTVVINNDNVDLNKYDSFCVEDFRNDDYMIKTCQEKTRCDSVPCIRKCCGHEEIMFLDTGKCERYVQDTVEPEFYDIVSKIHVAVPVFGLVESLSCEKEFLDPEIPKEASYINYKTGELVRGKNTIYNKNRYCVELLDNGTNVTYSTFACVEKMISEDIIFYVSLIEFPISSFFLILTIVVYFYLPDLLNIQGKIVVGNMTVLLMAYLTSFIVYAPIFDNTTACIIIAYIRYICFLSSFSWLNLLSIDICGSIKYWRKWQTFQDSKRFMYYLIYAVGFPLVMTIITASLENLSSIPHDYRPEFGRSTCFFHRNNKAKILLYYIPIGVQLIFNIILFTMTITYMIEVKKNIGKYRESLESKKQLTEQPATLLMSCCIKLYFVMGIPWILDICDYFYTGSGTLNVLNYIINGMHGVFIFIIFICKKSIMKKLLQKITKSRILNDESRTKSTKIGSNASSKNSVNNLGNVDGQASTSGNTRSVGKEN